MKLYDAPGAPSPRRVRFFMAEKGLTIPTVTVKLREQENLGEDFRRINPRGLVPVLELDDGTRIDESVAICRYLEELHPEPALLGSDALGKAQIEAWQRHVEFDGYLAVVAAFRNSVPAMQDRAIPGVSSGFPAIPELAERGRHQYHLFLEQLNRRLADSEFIAGTGFSIADITALVTIDFAGRIEITIPEEHGHTRRWYEQVSARPGAGA